MGQTDVFEVADNLKTGQAVEVTLNDGTSFSGEVTEIERLTGHGTFHDVFIDPGTEGVRYSLGLELADENVYGNKGTEEDGEYYWEGLGDVVSVTVK